MEFQIEKGKNFTALLSWGIVMAVLSAAYVIEIIKGLRTVPYVLGVVAVGVLPLIVAIVLYRAKPDNAIN